MVSCLGCYLMFHIKCFTLNKAKYEIFFPCNRYLPANNTSRRIHGLFLFLLMNNFIPLIISNTLFFFFFQGSPQPWHAVWIWPNIQWISRHVLCNWKAVRNLILIIFIQLEKYPWSFWRAVRYNYQRAWNFQRSQGTVRDQSSLNYNSICIQG